MSATVHSLFDAGEIAPSWLKEQLSLAGRSQSDLGKWMCLNQSAICRMCSGDRKISLSEAQDITAYLEATDLRRAEARAAPEPAPNSDVVVVPAQAEIEVYLGGTGGVVIKANDASLGGDEDQVIVIRPENVDAVVAALLRLKAEALAQ